MFDKDKFSLLLINARGDRTNKDYANDSGVSRAYISGYINKNIDNAPSPEIIKRLSDTIQNNVTYEDLMKAAGYIDTKYNAINRDIEIPEVLIKRDMQSIENDLKKMMQEIKTNPNEGMAAYGGEIDDDDLELLESAFRTALTVVKKINKNKYTPKKYRKDNN